MERYIPFDNEFSTRSGVFTTVSDKISIRLDAYGEYEYSIASPLDSIECTNIQKLDSLSNADEDTLSADLYASQQGIKHDSAIGYYLNLYCGHVDEGDFRKNGTSGGVASWILCQLLESGLVDGVVAATKSTRPEVLYEYSVLRSADEISANAKTRYYPMELSSVLNVIASNPGRYAIIGIPSFISDIRRLQKLDPLFQERIRFTISLLCGHQKTTKYGEAIAFQAGFEPGSITDIDFRRKVKGEAANTYVTEISGVKNGQYCRELRYPKQTFVNNWSAGMFKSNFSDFVDDCFGETADITLGDAWLPEYISDSGGNNVVIVRDSVIQSLIDSGLREGRLSFDQVDAKKIKDSQGGLIRHYREELPYRLTKRQASKVVKRTQPSKDLPFLRRRIQDLRVEIAAKSKSYYLEASVRSDWGYFEKKMNPMMRRYKLLYRLLQVQKLGLKGTLQLVIQKQHQSAKAH